MESGDHALLLNLIDEVEKLRTRHHDKIAPMLVKINAEIVDLMRRTQNLESGATKTDGLLTHWRDGLILALGAGLLYMLLHFGLPIEKP